MKKKVNKILLVTMLLFVTQLKAQKIITLEEAIGTTMQNNYNIKIFKNNTEALQKQATAGNAGLLPTISAVGNGNYGVNNSTFERLDIAGKIKIDDAKSFGYNGGIQMTYTIFDGLGTFHSFNKLKTSAEAAEIQERLNIETILLQTINAYFNVLRFQNNLKIQKEILDISRERMQREQLRFDMAGSSKLALLSAQVDFNTDSINYVNAKLQLHNSKLQLAQLMAQNDAPDFSVEEKFGNNFTLNYAQLEQTAIENNAALLNAEYNKKLNQLDLSIAQSAQMPRLSFQSSYNFNHLENEASIFRFSESYGYTSSLQLSVPLYDGSKRSIQTQTTRIRAENAELSKMEMQTTLLRDLKIAFANYLNAIQVSEMDNLQVETATLNFERSKEMFESGQINNTQFREAQLNLMRIKNQAQNNLINIKIAETELMRLSGQLIN